MNIAVLIKQVPGTNEAPIDPTTGVLKRDQTSAKMNPYDLYAIETAVRIKEQHSACVYAVSMGPLTAETVLREAFMMGSNKAVLLSDRRFAGSDVLATAHTLSQGLKQTADFDLIICGKMTTDGDTAQVGPQIAEFLDIPHITNVLEIVEIKNNSITVKSDMQNTIDTVNVSFPCLITVEKDIFPPRLPSYKLKKKTEQNEITTLTLDDLEDKTQTNYGLDGSPTKVKRIFPPDQNTNHEVWEQSGEQLADKLYQKLKELKFI